MKTMFNTLSRFAKLSAFVPLSICVLATSTVATSASAQTPVQKNRVSAEDEALKDAVTKAVLANPSRAAEIVADFVAKNPLSKASVIADAVGRLFLSNPAIAEQAPLIAVAMAKAIYAKPGSLDARATETGAALSTLAYHFAPHDSANESRILQLTTAGITATPEMDYTAQVYQVVSQTLSSLGASSSMLDTMQDQVVGNISSPSIRQQIAAVAQAPGTPQLPPVASGQILVTETKVDNR